MRLAATEVPPPSIPTYIHVLAVAFVVLAAFNVWRFRTGHMTQDRHRLATTDWAIRLGFAAPPLLIGLAAGTTSLFLFPVFVDHRSTLLAYTLLFGWVVFLAAIVLSVKEYWGPSRWNRTPEWLRDERARLEIDE